MFGCLLCLESNKDVEECSKVESTKWQETHIKELIDRLWSINTLTSESWLCPACWNELRSFQQFYVRIKELHDDFKPIMKMETDPLEEESKRNELLLENLLEPEIVIGQTLDMGIVIKQEIEEPSITHEDYLSYNEKEQVAADSHADDRCNSSEESETSDNDNYVPLVSRRNTKSCVETKATRNIRARVKDDVEAKSGPEVKSDGPRKSYYQPKTNRSEYDKFLQEHSKISCDICQQTFEKFHALCKHFRAVHNERGYLMCCQTKFFKSSLMVDHLNYHMNPDYFKCGQCDQVYTQRRRLTVHLKTHEEWKHCCDVCDKKFVEKSRLDRHKLTHLSEEEKKFPCSECGKFFANEYLLKLHIRVTHLNIYAKVCDICGQTMPDSHTFKLHMEKHDTSKPPVTYNCDECGLILSGKRTLKRHKDLKHPVDGPRDYTCGICMKVSPNMKALKKHIHCAHEMGYNHKCTMCEKAFKRLEHLKEHMSRHTGESLYRCTWCPKGFNSNGNMHNHRKKAHPIEWEEARRKKYSGNLPPNCKQPTTSSSQYVPDTFDYNQE